MKLIKILSLVLTGTPQACAAPEPKALLDSAQGDWCFSCNLNSLPPAWAEKAPKWPGCSSAIRAAPCILDGTLTPCSVMLTRTTGRLPG